MRYLILYFFAGLGLSSAGILTDPFHEAQTNCNYSATAPYSACDVIGNEMIYDIQKASVDINGSSVSVSLFLNAGGIVASGNIMSLTSFNDCGDNLMIGDLFFYDPSDPQSTLKFGAPLLNHGSFTAGDLYSISGSIGTETAFQALNGSGNYYRRDETVLLTGSGNAASFGTVTVQNYGDGVTDALYQVIINFAATSGFLNLLSGTEIGILFSSADCGNDVIQGTLDTRTPEPNAALLLGLGLAAIASVAWWRRRRHVMAREIARQA